MLLHCTPAIWYGAVLERGHQPQVVTAYTLPRQTGERLREDGVREYRFETPDEVMQDEVRAQWPSL